MRVCILTSNKPRHRYMANRVVERFDVVGVISEAKQPKRHIAEKIKHAPVPGSEEIGRYLQGFADKEREYLLPAGEDFRIPDHVPFLTVDPDCLNDRELHETIVGLKPNCFAVFGTSLVKRDLMDLSPHFVNIHLGLSPYYRGVACSFWPFFNDEPEYVGVTVFYLDEGIDSGPILHQSLVDLAPGDTIHDASVKAIISGVDLQLQALEEIENGTARAHPQDLTIGRTYYNKDFNVDVLRDCLARWDDERFDRYLAEQEQRKAKVDFVP